ncbi:MAG: lactate utilization protein [Eubacteriales bacterium]|nr:lactate utilization protein [Eubacteriales bacterium]
MDENRVVRNRMLAEKVIRGLESRNMEGFFAETKEKALEIALGLIPEGSSVGWGGSVSIAEIGLKDAVCSGSYQVYNRDACESPEEKRKTELAIMGSDYLLCSTNAITEDGILVNIDGRGNRVAGIIWGPEQVIMVVGMNKVVKNLEDAWSRARNEAAPINAQRFPIQTPCKKTGSCMDCKSPDTVCCQFVVTRYSKIPKRIKVILVNDDLGF